MCATSCLCALAAPRRARRGRAPAATRRHQRSLAALRQRARARGRAARGRRRPERSPRHRPQSLRCRFWRIPPPSATSCAPVVCERRAGAHADGQRVARAPAPPQREEVAAPLGGVGLVVLLGGVGVWVASQQRRRPRAPRRRLPPAAPRPPRGTRRRHPSKTSWVRVEPPAAGARCRARRPQENAPQDIPGFRPSRAMTAPSGGV
jgi:hypothetical protein